jgi:O-antigen/teichoic acid export membrane protein
MSNQEQTPSNNSREAAVMSVRAAAVWAMAGQYLSFGIQFATSVIISRLFLTPAEVGLFSIALSAALVVSVLQDFGLSRYIAGLPDIDAEDLARCSSVALLFSLVVAGTIAASAWPMAQTYHQSSLLPILLIIASSYLFVPLAVVPLALMGRSMSFRGHFTVNVGGALAQCIVALTLAAMGYSFALAWATLANGAARGIIAQILRPALPWPIRIDGLKPIVHTGSRLTSLYAIGALGSRTPDMIVGKLLGLISVGLYSRAVSLSDQFRMLISGAIGSVFYPAFARIRDRGDPLGPAYLRVVAGYTAVIWPGMTGLALCAEPIVRLLYGSNWLGVAPFCRPSL